MYFIVESLILSLGVGILVLGKTIAPLYKAVTSAGWGCRISVCLLGVSKAFSALAYRIACRVSSCSCARELYLTLAFAAVPHLDGDAGFESLHL